METGKEHSGSGWNTAVKERRKDLFDQIDSGFRCIKASNKEQATEYMKNNYTGEQDGGMFRRYKVWFNSCHHTYTDNKDKLFCFLVYRKLVDIDRNARDLARNEANKKRINKKKSHKAKVNTQ